jgi:hypothetical protein
MRLLVSVLQLPTVQAQIANHDVGRRTTDVQQPPRTWADHGDHAARSLAEQDEPVEAPQVDAGRLGGVGLPDRIRRRGGGDQDSRLAVLLGGLDRGNEGRGPVVPSRSEVTNVHKPHDDESFARVVSLPSIERFEFVLVNDRVLP